VDPSGSAHGDEVGITVQGRLRRQGWVLGDYSGFMSPDAWGRRAVRAYHDHRADRIVAEKNFGGEMVALTIHTVDETVPVKLVTASRGKMVRAEPVAALYEQARIFHAALFPELEEQLLTWTQDDPESPGRLDALVWGFTDLMVETLEGPGTTNTDWLTSQRV
jgi:phage terminase large subunit-like protein